MAKSTPHARISDVEIATAVIAHEAVDCFVGKEQEESAQSRELVSCMGGVFYGKPGETWPLTEDNEPLIPWLQIVCTEMTRLYGAFYQKKAVAFYLRQGFSATEATSTPDSGNFVVREYGLKDTLIPLARPKELEGHPFHQVIWERRPDFPSLSKYYGLFDPAVYKMLCDRKNLKYENQHGIKIGGWPTPVQAGQRYPGTYDLQIDMTENFMYGDSGIGYLRRGGDRWYVNFDCC